MNVKPIIKNIIIKNYQEFVEEIQIEGVTVNAVTIAKEVEAVVVLESGMNFSLGFSITRENDSFRFDSPRRIVQKFLLENFNFEIQLQE
jgi:arginine repressor